MYNAPRIESEATNAADVELFGREAREKACTSLRDFTETDVLKDMRVGVGMCVKTKILTNQDALDVIMVRIISWSC